MLIIHNDKHEDCHDHAHFSLDSHIEETLDFDAMLLLYGAKMPLAMQ